MEETRTSTSDAVPQNLSDASIDMLEPPQVLESLERLDDSLKALQDDDSSLVGLTSYRSLPPLIVQAKDILLQGSQLVHGTATKYTLVGKIDKKEQTKIAQDLLRGCQLVGTATLLFHEGCGVSARRYVRQASRAIVRTVQQLIQSFVDGTAFQDNVGAQKTGAVWSTCDAIIQKKVPIGNRNAIRRELLTYSVECNETVQEFEEMLEAEDGDDKNEEPSFDDFLQGNTDQYSAAEKPLATAGVFLVKCTRGSLNIALQACEAIGARLDPDNVDGSVDNGEAKNDEQPDGSWTATLVEVARTVGDGMTDTGASMYPPLNLDEVEDQIEKQCQRIGALVQHVQEYPNTDAFTEETQALITKVQAALITRQEEARDAISRARA